MDCRDALARLETIEADLLSTIQTIRTIRGELTKAIELSPTLEALLSAEDVAKLLGVEPPYLYGLARSRKIPSIKLGKYRRFSPLQIKKWLERKANT